MNRNQSKINLSQMAMSLICFLAAALLSGCATVPNGGYHPPIKEVGIPGESLGTVQVGEGMLVKNIYIDPETAINIQINEDKQEGKPLLFDNVLTIGKFSRILGSGFTGERNIYYRKRIHESGTDLFSVGSRIFLVSWKCDYKDARTLVSDHYTVSVQELFPLIKEDATPEM